MFALGLGQVGAFVCLTGCVGARALAAGARVRSGMVFVALWGRGVANLQSRRCVIGEVDVARFHSIVFS
jgi:hypothetical protein